MAIYTNVVKEFRKEIEDNLKLDDVIDVLIAQKLIDEKHYVDIWNHQNRVGHLLDIVLKDGKRSNMFIDILGNISHMKSLAQSIKTSIDKINRMIVLGGFPEFSLNYVVRNSVANTIQNRALELSFGIGSTLVVHGLPGFGKSCLVNQVLQTKRFLEASDEAMFWINLGEHLDTTTVINPLWNLYLNAVKLTNQLSPLVHRPEDLTLLQNELKRIFLDEKLKNAFIILDDVKSNEVLKVFKLHRKIIVTTQDKNVANDSEAYFIKVTTGFTKKESLELLRKSLDTDNLSSKENYVHKIHDLCDGCPMLLNIIGSILKDSREEALSTDVIWNSVVDEIIKNDYLLHPTTTNVIHMIQMFVTHLNLEVQECFHSLAVFPKHVNIRPEILMKLWDRNYYAVRKIMVELENKSLVVSFFNKDLKTYIYSIHSLVRIYLVEIAQVDIKQYHKKMISQCDDAIKKAPPDDPIANYIFGYYGYHATNAGLYDRFVKYFDLSFIENKIKRIGSADLLTDFEIYRDLITEQDPILESKLKDYIKFVNSYSSHLHISPETNVVQFAFFSNNNCVYEEAKNIALNNSDHLYFKVDPYSGKQKNFPVLSSHNIVTSTCFLDSKEVLVGTSDGTIEIKSFRQYHNKVNKVHVFEGHTGAVFSLQISSDGKSFLSISNDHTARLWRFVEDLDPQSPKCKQSNWKNLHSPDENYEQHKIFKMQDGDFIISAAFPHDNSEEIVTASNKGRIARWNTKSKSIIRQSEWGFRIPRILYSHDSQQIIFSYDGKIFLYSRENLLYKGQFVILDYVNDFLLTPTSSRLKAIVAISRKRFEMWEYDLKIKKYDFEADSEITSSSINDDHLVLGTANYIYVYSFIQEKLLQYKNGYGEPTSILILPDRVTFICLNKEKVQRCELHLAPREKPIVHDLSLFSCYWKESSPIYFIVNKDNRVDIFNGHSTILSGIDEITGKITCGVFSLCGNYVILGTEKGNVHFYNYKKQKINSLKICDGTVSLIKCFENDMETGDVYDSDMYGKVVASSNRKIIVIIDKEVKVQISISAVLSEIFYINSHLITIDVSGRVSIRGLHSDQEVGWLQEKYNEVIVVEMHKGKRLLAVASKENGWFCLKVHSFFLNNPLAIKTIFETKFYSKPKCLCFSYTGKLLSMGCENGNIEVYNLDNKFQEVLALHKKSVEKLLFAPNFEPVLVSLGDQIAWWNLHCFQEKSVNSDVEKISRQLTLLNCVNWKEKKLHDTVPYLLTSTNLHGKQLHYISCSKDFRSFLIIDIDGNIFKMDIIDC